MAEVARPVLVVLHQETSTAGRVGERLQSRGYRLDIRRPRFGDPLPTTLDDHTGAIVFGGPMSANDDEPYINVETDWLAVPLSEGAPLIGLCLGAQMLARHLGARVWPHDDGHVEIGWFGLNPTEAGRRILSWPAMVHQFHVEGFDLPRGASLLATGDDQTFPNQAFAFGPSAFAIQFHIELTEAMVARWTSRIGERAKLPGGYPQPHHFDGRARYDAATSRFAHDFLDHWLASDQRGA
ncbi:MAG: glutamine amidotransferase [Alphaproteobacteria bacterium]